uniref:SMODS and SLOG-associating 2TM effector domain-containing protein n=1 Tax=viral metagenome TaxID=1070528 RepID=A0A6C0C192_9ZZZZ
MSLEEEPPLDEEQTEAPKQLSNTLKDDDAGSAVPTEPLIKIEWSPENEMILVEWCDAAQCYKWLHSRSHVRYASANAWFTIPAIVLSTISGTASFAQTSLPDEYKPLAPVAIGSLNIFIGILTTIQQYLKISELNEAHRAMSIAWDKYARNIRIELSKAPIERSDATSFLKHTRQEFDRLMETSPPIDQKIINEFIATFKGKEGTPMRKRYENLKKPDICNIIVSANEARHHWYKDLELTSHPPSTIGDNAREHYIHNQSILLDQKERALKEKEHSIIETDMKKQHARANFRNSVTMAAKKYKVEEEKLTEYVKSFTNLYGRKPIGEEIQTYVNTYMEEIINSDSLDTFLRQYENNGPNNV